jgi:plastocyanin
LSVAGRLLQISSGIAVLLLIIGLAVLGPDPIFIALAILLIVGFVLLRRRARAGAAVIILPSLVILLFAAPSGFFVATHPIAFYDPASALFTLLPLLALLSLLGAIGTLIEGRVPTLRSPTTVTALAVLAAVVVVVVAIAGGVAHVGLTNATPAPGDLSISATKNTTFTTGTLTATQKVSIFVTNPDDTFHTFTIDGVVSQQLTPGSGHRVTFTLKPGQYRYYCTVPGHADTMHGILTVH